MLSIEDLTFDVADATLEGNLVDGKLLWSVSVTTAPKTIGGQTWKPHAYLDDYPAPSRSFGDLMEDGWTIPSARELSGGRLSDLAFVAEAPIDLLGFWVPATSERQARRMIKPVFDVAYLEYHREPGRDGSYFLPPAREDQ